ncbi:hypothetical protein QFC20_003838 [Naganishia adeliensis]|uniref:Uncharacterized protein n=1 Tax=Naganishia adeliensis TaxID=92952 RepID=A0ACC2W6K8_9TREE|nr:hypothetical protein QFC20_003838 [Naganishia adeliensis]
MPDTNNARAKRQSRLIVAKDRSYPLTLVNDTSSCNLNLAKRPIKDSSGVQIRSTSGAAVNPDQSAVTANATLAAAPAATPAAAPAATPAAAPGTQGMAAPDQSPPAPMPPPPGQPPVGPIPSLAVNAGEPAGPAAIIEVPSMAMVKRDGWTSRLGNATAGCFSKRR